LSRRSVVATVGGAAELVWPGWPMAGVCHR
jgi:hypothetical protein